MSQRCNYKMFNHNSDNYAENRILEEQKGEFVFYFSYKSEDLVDRPVKKKKQIKLNAHSLLSGFTFIQFFFVSYKHSKCLCFYSA